MTIRKRPISRRAFVAGTAAFAANLLHPDLAPGSGAAASGIWDAHTHLHGVTGTVRQRVDQMLLVADRMGIE
jgi:hypothetical protein